MKMKGAGNLALALLIIVIIVMGAGFLAILISGPPIILTGAATGKTNLTIQQLVSIRMIRNISDFGTGTTTAGQLIHLYSNDTNPNGFYNGSEGNGTDYGTGTTRVYPFVVENDGNDATTCVKVSGDPASTFIGGSSPIFEFAGKNNETGSCTSGLQTSWTAVTGTLTTVCQSLNSADASDEIRIHWHIGIPSDAAQGSKSNTITVQGSDTC